MNAFWLTVKNILTIIILTANLAVAEEVPASYKNKLLAGFGIPVTILATGTTTITESLNIGAEYEREIDDRFSIYFNPRYASYEY